MAVQSHALSKQRAGVAFHYAAAFSPRDIAWYTRFELLVTGAILNPALSRRLKRDGSRLAAYEWTAGYYPGDAASAPGDWQQAVAAKGKEWILTDAPVGGGAAGKGRTAHWYDFGSDSLIETRARALASRLAQAGYHGFFFDTPGFEHLPPAAQQAFRSRHPRMDYNERLGVFLAALRRAMLPGQLVFLNQGYRHAAHLLPHADLDLSESSFTGVGRGGTMFRPWHDPAKPWESVRTPMYDLIMPALRTFPKVRMVHLNYACGTAEEIRRAQRYSYAYSLILGHEGYLVVPDSAIAEEGEAYFTNLGPAQDYWREEPSGVVWRRFQYGVAAVNASGRPASIPSLGLPLPEPMQGYIFPSKS